MTFSAHLSKILPFISLLITLKKLLPIYFKCTIFLMLKVQFEKIVTFIFKRKYF